MDIQQVNATLTTAIEHFQASELEMLWEFTVPGPHEMHRKHGMVLPADQFVVPTPAQVAGRSQKRAKPVRVKTPKGYRSKGISRKVASSGYEVIGKASASKPTMLDPSGQQIDPDVGPAPNMSLVKKFAKMFQKIIDDGFRQEYPENPDIHIRTNQISIKPRKKFVAIDVGGSGKLLVGPNDFVWGIKGYGKRHPAMFYGTLSDLIRRGFGYTGYYIVPK